MEGVSNLTGTIVAKYAFPYNARLNLTGSKLFIPSDIPHLNLVFNMLMESMITKLKKPLRKHILIKHTSSLKPRNEKVMVQFLSGIPMNIVNPYFFYPNINAKELIIERIDNNGVKSYSYSKLHKHEHLTEYTEVSTQVSLVPPI